MTRSQPDFAARVVAVEVRIVRREGVRHIAFGIVDIDPENLAEQHAQILAVPVRIALGSAVPETDVEETIWAEQHQPAVVVRVRLLLEEDGLSRLGIGDVWIVRANLPAFDVAVAVDIGVVDEEGPVLGEVRVERHAQQPLLGSGADLTRNVEEGRLLDLPVLENQDLPALEHDEEAPVAVVGVDHMQRLIQAFDDGLQIPGRSGGVERGALRATVRTGEGGAQYRNHERAAGQDCLHLRHRHLAITFRGGMARIGTRGPCRFAPQSARLTWMSSESPAHSAGDADGCQTDTLQI
jgi:hypothetical protein